MRIWDQSRGSLAREGRIKLGDPEEEEVDDYKKVKNERGIKLGCLESDVDSLGKPGDEFIRKKKVAFFYVINKTVFSKIKQYNIVYIEK